MGYERIFNEEISAELDRLQAGGERWVANWITHTIVGRHEPEIGRDAEFWRYCGYSTVRDAVRRHINGRAGDRPERDERQLRLPGYEHLQAYYIVKRKRLGEVGVPIQQMTDQEFDEKIGRYEAMGANCMAHAEELRRYKDARRAGRRRKSA